MFVIPRFVEFKGDYTGSFACLALTGDKVEWFVVTVYTTRGIVDFVFVHSGLPHFDIGVI